MNQMSDEELLQKIVIGDEFAFNEFFERYKNRAFSLLQGICKNKFDAEEALQDVFMKVYDYASTFKGSSKVSTWFYTITYRTGLSYVKSRKKFKAESLDNFVENNFKDTSEQTDFVKQELVLKLICELPEKQNIILTLFYLNELSVEEISKILKLTESDIKTTLHRARLNMFEIIKSKNLLAELKW